MPSPEISVIIINYGTADLAIAAVESVLARHHGGRAVDIHVVDNASPGKDADILRQTHADRGWGKLVTLYPERVNHGFGRGNNLVLHALAARPRPPEKVFLLNPDAQLENEALDILAAFLDSHPDAGCAGASIANPDGRLATAAFRFPSAISEFSDSLAFGPVARLFRRHSVALPPDLPTQRVQWVAGAAAMLRWEAVWQCRGFDPTFFLYFEEVDLLRQFAGKGWETWYVPEARVTHVEGAATNVKSGRVERKPHPDYWYDSWLIYHLKAHGPWGARLCAAARLAGWSANRAVSFLRRRPTLAPQFYLDGFSRRILRPLAGLPARDAA
jgi:GT2 family glycosyltransferase